MSAVNGLGDRLLFRIATVDLPHRWKSAVRFN